ncbi:MAG: hypothetical protein R3345_04635, partial [Fulvivirga sp.]|nr:hypothetical protein [Fulvivirga sp.]
IEKVNLPLFPLSILPLPKEQIPLHIFEPRYKQLIDDVAVGGKKFGIYYSHGLNKDQLGSTVKLETIVKKYLDGALDIIVSCSENFLLTEYHEQMKSKLYPGGIIAPLDIQDHKINSKYLEASFNEFLLLKGEQAVNRDFDIRDIAVALQLSVSERLKYLKLIDKKKRETFLQERLNFKKFLLKQEAKIENNLFLN